MQECTTGSLSCCKFEQISTKGQIGTHLAQGAKFQSSMDFLEYPSVSAEVRGAMVGGNLKITDKEVIFKHAKSGKKEVVKVARFILSF